MANLLPGAAQKLIFTNILIHQGHYRQNFLKKKKKTPRSLANQPTASGGWKDMLFRSIWISFFGVSQAQEIIIDNEIYKTISRFKWTLASFPDSGKLDQSKTAEILLKILKKIKTGRNAGPALLHLAWDKQTSPTQGIYKEATLLLQHCLALKGAPITSFPSVLCRSKYCDGVTFGFHQTPAC